MKVDCRCFPLWSPILDKFSCYKSSSMAACWNSLVLTTSPFTRYSYYKFKQCLKRVFPEVRFHQIFCEMARLWSKSNEKENKREFSNQIQNFNFWLSTELRYQMDSFGILQFSAISCSPNVFKIRIAYDNIFLCICIHID